MVLDHCLETKLGWSKKPDAVVYSVCAITLLGIFLLDLFIPLGVATGVLYVVVVLLALWIPKQKPVILFAVMASVLIVAAVFFKPSVAEMWKVLFNRGISLLAIWTTVALGLQRNAIEAQRHRILLEREKTLEEIRILQGLLPICASCKKIRDDNDSWVQLEGYIREHSEAEFTHSICPDCAARLYPDFTG